MMTAFGIRNDKNVIFTRLKSRQSVQTRFPILTKWRPENPARERKTTAARGCSGWFGVVIEWRSYMAGVVFGCHCCHICSRWFSEFLMDLLSKIWRLYMMQKWDKQARQGNAAFCVLSWGEICADCVWPMGRQIDDRQTTKNACIDRLIQCTISNTLPKVGTGRETFSMFLELV